MCLEFQGITSGTFFFCRQDTHTEGTSVSTLSVIELIQGMRVYIRCAIAQCCKALEIVHSHCVLCGTLEM